MSSLPIRPSSSVPHLCSILSGALPYFLLCIFAISFRFQLCWPYRRHIFPVRSGAFVQPTERIIFTIAGPDETGSIAHPDSAGSFLLHKWIWAEPSINQHNASSRQRVDRPTVRMSLTMQAHPHAPRCFHHIMTRRIYDGHVKVHVQIVV